MDVEKDDIQDAVDINIDEIEDKINVQRNS
jgi:hypothetical protein